jgi:hypothetical protein
MIFPRKVFQPGLQVEDKLTAWVWGRIDMLFPV